MTLKTPIPKILYLKTNESSYDNDLLFEIIYNDNIRNIHTLQRFDKNYYVYKKKDTLRKQYNYSNTLSKKQYSKELTQLLLRLQGYQDVHISVHEKL